MSDHDLPHDDAEGIDDLEDELAALRALAAEVRAEPTEWTEPPAGLWESIEAATTGSEASNDTGAEPASDQPDGDRTPIDPVPMGTGLELVDLGLDPAPGETGRPETAAVPNEVAPPTLFGPRRGRLPKVVPWLGAAAAAIILVVALVVLPGRSGDDGDLVAAVDLELLGDAGSGRAELIGTNGSYRLRLDTADLDPGDGFLELWLIDTEVSKLVSLGPLRADGAYELPDSIDPRDYPVVDVSVEPVDGDPTHSGNSVLRGMLEI